MKQRLIASIIGGPVTVAYEKVGKEWHSVALEFDLVGIGKSKRAALEELRSLVNEYLSCILNEDGPVQVQHHSSPEEWDNPDKERYRVIAMCVKKKEERIPEHIRHITGAIARRHRDSVRSFDLIPALAN